MITTLFQAASTTTTSSHPRGQHDQSPASQRVRRRGKGGHDNDFVSRGQHDHIQSPNTAATGERGEGGKKGGKWGGHDNDLQSPTRPARPGEPVDDEATASPPTIYTASTTSHPHPVTRAAMCEREEGGEGAGMITTFLHAASTTTSSHPPRNGHTNDFVGGCFILCWRLCPEQGTGEGGGGAGRLQASAPSRLCTQREGGGGE